MGRETDVWPFVQAKYYQPFPAQRAVRLIVIHDMEYDEVMTAAEDVAKYFSTMPDGRKASAHVCVDPNSIVQCVHDHDIAYGAPGANSDGIQIELAGVQRQTRAQWMDDYSDGVILRAADVVAQYLVKYDLPCLHLTDDQLADGKQGIVGHDQVSRVYHKSDHTDPGPNFPWDVFMTDVARSFVNRKTSNAP
jgi:N-acetyl-anhydromuramyl-L-alanine amidase AmpD